MLAFAKLSYLLPTPAASAATSTPSAGQRVILASVSGQVSPNSLIVLTGQSGSGKSVLLRLLAGLLPPTSGTLTWDSHTLQQLTPAQWHAHMAYVFQLAALIEGTVLDNLQLPFGFDFYQQRQFDQ